jgi:hypothetical protein
MVNRLKRLIFLCRDDSEQSSAQVEDQNQVIANVRFCSEGGAGGSCWSPLHGSQYLARGAVHVGYFPMVAWLG